MRVCDGFLFTGGRPNVHPSEYGIKETEAHGEFDRGRDAVSLSLIRNCVEIGQPIFGICRGFQEVAVAFGSELHPEIRDIPDRDNHRMPPDGTLEEKFALRHEVTVSDEGPFKKLFGKNRVLTNTLHGQGIMKPGKRVIIDGYAHDGTPEALYIADAPGSHFPFSGTLNIAHHKTPYQNLCSRHLVRQLVIFTVTETPD